MTYPRPLLGTPYTDYGPAGDRRRALRPHCDMCGPFAGRYARRIPSGYWKGDVVGGTWIDESFYRCKGCDEENA